MDTCTFMSIIHVSQVHQLRVSRVGDSDGVYSCISIHIRGYEGRGMLLMCIGIYTKRGVILI